MKKNRKTMMTAMFSLAILGLGLFFLKMPAKNAGSPGNAIALDQAVVYRSPTCGCCANYVSYLKKNRIKVETKFVDDINEIQSEYFVPESMRSCHLTKIGNYAVVGHVPIEAISKLLNDKPEISGIALSGMPSGSPGMPGAKREQFMIYGFSADGSSSLFESL